MRTRLTPLWLLALAACTNQDLPTGVLKEPIVGPSFVVSDGANGGNSHFYFLPPLVDAPSPTGTFDGTQSPEVKICLFTGGACGTEVAAFTMTSGSGSEIIRVVALDQQYIVNWHTDLSGLVLGSTYRIRVLVGNQVLGFADVVPLAGKELKNAVTGEEIALKDGSTLPIKFRIEGGAVITTPPDPIPTLGSADWEGIAAGTGFTCALTNTGKAYCWGINTYGKLGLGYYSSDSFDQPQEVIGGQTFASVTAGSAHACALKADASAWCWGSNENGTLGRGTKTYSEGPGPVSGGLLFASLSASLYNTCGRTTGGDIYCWGKGSHGMNGTFADATTPVKVVVAGNPQFAYLSLSTSHACALTVAGVPYCWGNNDQGQLGRGFTGGDYSTPDIAVGGEQFKAISTPHRSTCALTPTGEAKCWGMNDYGQLGLGYSSFSPSLTAVSVIGGLTFARIYSGERQSCGLNSGGVAYCWGWNEWAQLGVGFISTKEATPTAVAGGKLFGALSMAISHTCGVNGNGVARCWGQNIYLQLGNPDPATAPSPVDVASPLTFMSH